MLNLIEKAWSQYERERAAGNPQAAETFGDVYDALNALDIGEDAEENRDFLEKTYYAMGALAFRREGFKPGALTEILKGLEEKLVAVGILEWDEEEPEEAAEHDSETHWDEWVADQRYEAYRDYDMAMGYER